MRITNWPLLMQVMEYVIEHPEHYTQTSYHCGSQRCIAGWTVHFDLWVDNPEDQAYVLPKGSVLADMHYEAISLAEVDIEYAAAQSLGVIEDYAPADSDEELLTEQLNEMLFSAYLEWPEILRNVRELAMENDEALTIPVVREMRLHGIAWEGALR